jgi:hypothetical protein
VAADAAKVGCAGSARRESVAAIAQSVLFTMAQKVSAGGVTIYANRYLLTSADGAGAESLAPEPVCDDDRTRRGLSKMFRPEPRAPGLARKPAAEGHVRLPARASRGPT